MHWISLALAFLLPLFLGAAFVDLLIARTSRGRAPLVWGNGMLLGLFIVPLVMRLQDLMGIPLTFPFTAALLCALLFGAALARRWRARTAKIDALHIQQLPVLTAAQKVLFGVLALLILVRSVSLGMELVWHPLFGWDATMHWATKARVWFATESIAPFVENEQWLEMGGAGVYTDHHPGYPMTIPLLQVWVSSALGNWDESLINLPWLVCFWGLGLAFYGQSRAAGATPVLSMTFTYLLLSLPLLNSHVALAGYADLLMGVCYCAAIMAFHNWSVSREPGQGVLALLFILFCPLVKNEGFYWSLTFLPALVFALLPFRWAIAVFASGLLGLVAILLLMPPDLAVVSHSLERLDLQYRPSALRGIFISIWVQDNWHLFGYLLVSLSLLCLYPSGSVVRSYRGIITALLMALILFLVLFLFTKYARSAERFTAVGRISLHLVPSFMFMGLLLLEKVSSQASGRWSGMGTLFETERKPD